MCSLGRRSLLRRPIMARPSRSVVRFYNECGTAEQWIKEGSRRRIGRDCPVIGSGRTKCASS
jgi:hypothetical protein